MCTPRQQNYNVDVIWANPVLLGVPQSRERVYVVGVWKNVSSQDTMSDFIPNMYKQFIVDDTSMLHLDNFLLPDNHPMVEAELHRLSSARLSDKQNARAPKPKKPRNAWVEKSIQEALSTSILTGQTWGFNQWDDPTVAASHPWWHVLSQREQDIVILHEVDGRDMVGDVTQAPGFGKVSSKNCQLIDDGWVLNLLSAIPRLSIIGVSLDVLGFRSCEIDSWFAYDSSVSKYAFCMSIGS